MNTDKIAMIIDDLALGNKEKIIAKSLIRISNNTGFLSSKLKRYLICDNICFKKVTPLPPKEIEKFPSKTANETCRFLS